MNPEALTLEGPRGHTIHALHWPAAPARGLLQISHGMSEYAARYAGLAQWAVGLGWSVIAHDHYGHGPHARPEDLGHFGDQDGWRNAVADLRIVREHARGLCPNVPVVLLGHSMGSFLSLTDQTDAPGTVDALVLTATKLGGPSLLHRAGLLAAKAERFRQGGRGKSGLLHFLSFDAFNRPFRPTRTEADWISRDEAVVDAYVKDPLCGFRATNQFWIDQLEGLIRIGQDEALKRLPKDLPLLLMSGSEDMVSDRATLVYALERRLKALGLTRVSVRVFEGARHEILNEINRDEVRGALRQFLETVCPIDRAATSAES